MVDIRGFPVLGTLKLAAFQTICPAASSTSSLLSGGVYVAIGLPTSPKTVKRPYFSQLFSETFLDMPTTEMEIAQSSYFARPRYPKLAARHINCSFNM
jgi:hypothetical protein